MARVVFVLAVIASFASVHAEPTAKVLTPPATMPTTSPSHPLADLLPRIPGKLGEADLKRFEVIGEAKFPGFPLQFRIAQTDPGTRLLYLAYASDGVPIMVSVNDDLVMYDAVTGVVRRIKGARPHLDWNATADTVNFGAGINISEKKPPGVLANIDFHSTLKFGVADNAKFDRVAGFERVRSTGKQGTILQLLLDRDQPMPLTRVELFSPKEEPILVFSRITTDQPVDWSLKLPDDEAFEKAMTTRVYQKNSILDNAALSLAFLRSVSYRLALGDPSMRPQVEKFTGKIDWDARIKQDAEIAAPLIKLFGQQLPTEPPAK
jgi:hypothetical protein